MERQNQLIDNLRCMCGNNVDDWPEMVPYLQFSHNTSRNATTGQSPQQLVSGNPARRPEQVIVREATCGDADYNIPDLSNAAVAQKLVREKTRRILEATQAARRRMAAAQESRNIKYSSRGVGFRVGDLARLKISPAEWRLGGGNKISPYLSRRHRVVKVLRGGWSFQVIPDDEPTGRMKVRHCYELERAPTKYYSWEAPYAEERHPINDSKEARPPLRHTMRERRPPKRLQVNPKQATYEDVEEEYWDDDTGELDEDVDCNDFDC